MNPNRPTGGQRKAIQKRGRRKLAQLLRKQNNQCHWCQRPLVKGSNFPPERILRSGCDWVIWVNDAGEEIKSWWATTDHLVPVRDNGSSDITNLVASCGPCNRHRGAIDNPLKQKPKWENNEICRCGRAKHPKLKRCHHCQHVSAQVKALCQMAYISKDQGACKRCGCMLIFYAEVETVGSFYRCPSCVKGPRYDLPNPGDGGPLPTTGSEPLQSSTTC